MNKSLCQTNLFFKQQRETKLQTINSHNYEKNACQL